MIIGIDVAQPTDHSAGGLYTIRHEDETTIAILCKHIQLVLHL